jgi:hypothetical protein
VQTHSETTGGRGGGILIIVYLRKIFNNCCGLLKILMSLKIFFIISHGGFWSQSVPCLSDPDGGWGEGGEEKVWVGYGGCHGCAVGGLVDYSQFFSSPVSYSLTPSPNSSSVLICEYLVPLKVVIGDNHLFLISELCMFDMLNSGLMGHQMCLRNKCV